MRKLDLTPSSEKNQQDNQQNPNNQSNGSNDDNSNGDNSNTNKKTKSKQDPVDSTSPVGDNQSLSMKKFLKPITIAAIIAVVAGVGTGFAANQFLNNRGDTGVPKDGQIQRLADEDVAEGDVFGSADEETFKDSAEGYLEAGGLDGEGSHHLLRPGGEAQTVYLTSSVTDLDKLVGMEVKVWGETFQGQKAGWLMDVGRIKVLKVNGESPVVE